VHGKWAVACPGCVVREGAGLDHGVRTWLEVEGAAVARGHLQSPTHAYAHRLMCVHVRVRARCAEM
jgi:hypothetical protein